MKDVRDILDTVVWAAKRAKATQIDAGCCSTDQDFRKAREAEDALHAAVDTAENDLREMIGQATGLLR